MAQQKEHEDPKKIVAELNKLGLGPCCRCTFWQESKSRKSSTDVRMMSGTCYLYPKVMLKPALDWCGQYKLHPELEKRRSNQLLEEMGSLYDEGL